jgi:hypothetical protein
VNLDFAGLQIPELQEWKSATEKAVLPILSVNFPYKPKII